MKREAEEEGGVAMAKPLFKAEDQDEWDEPTDQALQEVNVLKAENAEVMKALQAIKEELMQVAAENTQIMRKLKCVPTDDVDDFDTPGGEYYNKTAGFSSDEDDPLGDLDELMDLSGVRQNAINLVNTLIGDDGAIGDDYGMDTIGGYGNTANGFDDFNTAGGPDGNYNGNELDDILGGGGGGYGGDNIDDLLSGFDKDIGDDDW